MATPLIQRLEQFSSLSAEDKRVLSEAVSEPLTVKAHKCLLGEGEAPDAVYVMLQGYACPYKLLPSGERQIMALFVAGDLYGLSGVLLGRLDHSIGTLTPCSVARIPRSAILDIIDHHPSVARALWQLSLTNAAILGEWTINLGRRSAYQRVAHLLCETWLRLRLVGLTRDGGYEFPITQAEIADATGLSLVHANRVLQKLRQEGLITTQGKTLVIADWERLQEAGLFDPGYLYLRPRSGSEERRSELGVQASGIEIRPDLRTERPF